MPSRHFEEMHLTEANRRIAEGEQRLAHLEAVVARIAVWGKPDDAEVGAAAVAVIREIIGTFKVNRDLILKTLADLDAGTLDESQGRYPLHRDLQGGE